MKTREECLVLVLSNSNNFLRIPKKFMTLEFCKEAVKNSYNFPHVPKEFIKSILSKKLTFFSKLF